MQKIVKHLFISLVLATLVLSSFAQSVSAASQTQLSTDFAAAAKEFKVPEEILLAIAYNQSRWESHNGKPSVAGGYGVMHLTSEFTQEDGQGKTEKLHPKATPAPRRTLDEAAKLLNVSKDELKHSDKQNIRGAAALLAQYAKQSNDGKLPSSAGDWSGAVAQLSAIKNRDNAADFVKNTYDTMSSGASATNSEGQMLNLAPHAAKLNQKKLDEHLPARLPATLRSGETNKADCPATLDCDFTPARYAQNDPNNPYDYGNYSLAKRPHDMKIKYIVIHDTEGSYQSTIDWFQNPASYVSAHYVIRSSDGKVTQTVENKNVPWHAGNWYMNMHSIGVEHEGFAAEGDTWYTDAMYRSSAKLVKHLAKEYGIPLDREHILGHDQYQALSPGGVANMHHDPGPYWNWEYYMQLLGAPVHQNALKSDAVTITPHFKHNKPFVTSCDPADTDCVEVPKQDPANFIYLRQAPNKYAPYINDKVLRPDGSPGTTHITDLSAKVNFGQQFAVADREGEWIAIWFGGQKGWFKNSSGRGHNAVSTRAKLVAPKEGKESIPIYGGAYPEGSAYPTTIQPVSLTPLPYTIPTDQKYPLYARSTPTDYFYDMTFDRSVPDDNSVVVGNEKYIPISYNHRQAFVKASDVTVVRTH